MKVRWGGWRVGSESRVGQTPAFRPARAAAPSEVVSRLLGVVT